MTTPDPIIVSAPHTGTRFLKERLGIKDHIHTTTDWDSLLRRIEGRHVIVPLRNPPDVWRSWCRRSDPKRFFHGQFYISLACLQMLNTVIDIDVICVDKQEDPRITDWGKVGDTDPSRVGWQLLRDDMRAVYKLTLINDHYGPRSTWQEKQHVVATAGM